MRVVESLVSKNTSPPDLRSYGEAASAELEKMIAGSQSPSEPLTLVPVPPTPQKRPPKLPFPVDRRSAFEQVADEAIKLIRPRIEPQIAGFQTWSDWRTENRRVAVGMAKAGMTAEEIDDAHREHSESRGRSATLKLRYVQSDLVAANASKPPEKEYTVFVYDGPGALPGDIG